LLHRHSKLQGTSAAAAAAAAAPQADRRLRSEGLPFDRIRVDAKDFLLAGTPGLGSVRGSPAEPYVKRPRGQQAQQGGGQQQAAGSTGGQQEEARRQQQQQQQQRGPGQPVRWVAIGKHLCGAATDYTLRACMLQGAAPLTGQDAAPAADAGAAAAAAAVGRHPGLLGMAIAPCCHHRCSWRAFVAKPQLRALGFSPAEFELISWMTGGLPPPACLPPALWARNFGSIYALAVSGSPVGRQSPEGTAMSWLGLLVCNNGKWAAAPDGLFNC
jgi:hypothetical protein